MPIDLKRQLPGYTAAQGEFAVLTVPAARYLMVDGSGDPNTSPAYREALAALFPVAYRLRFLSRDELGRDHTVMPLEGLWWSDDMASFTGGTRDKSRWAWTLMILVPEWIAPEHVAAAKERVGRRHGSASLDALRLEPLDEGLCVQTLHVGAYDDEAAVLTAMHEEFIPSHGLRRTGTHHEIYLSDARRTPAARLRTILRQPVARIGR